MNKNPIDIKTERLNNILGKPPKMILKYGISILIVVLLVVIFITWTLRSANSLRSYIVFLDNNPPYIVKSSIYEGSEKAFLKSENIIKGETNASDFSLYDRIYKNNDTLIFVPLNKNDLLGKIYLTKEEAAKVTLDQKVEIKWLYLNEAIDLGVTGIVEKINYIDVLNIYEILVRCKRGHANLEECLSISNSLVFIADIQMDRVSILNRLLNIKSFE